MIKTIVPAHEEQVKRLVLEYQYIDMPTAGLNFDYADGKPVFQCPEAEKNYQWCKEHPEKVVNKGLKTIRIHSRVPAFVECECGERFYLIDRYYGCCQCAGCGTWYSVCGQELNPPDQWREDFEPDE